MTQVLPRESIREGANLAEGLSTAHHLGGFNPSDIKNENASGRQSRTSNSDVSAGTTQSRFSRNRREVIELARKMLESGETASRVSDLLPLSESELNMATIGTRGNAA